MKITRHFPKSTLFIVFTFAATTISAQSVIDNLCRAPTPQAADLGRFGDIPMSYHTGRACVTIPVFSFTERGVTLDVSLSYDTSGLLLNKLPGLMGPGWTINAGGCITRIQNNFCDEMVFDSHYSFSNEYNNYFHSYNQMILPNGMADLEGIFNINGFGYHDYSPDIFYFNFMGKTGHFFLGNDGTWKVSSDDNIIVAFDYENTDNYITPVFSTFPASYAYKQPKSIKGFTLYDDDGTSYTFGGDTTSIEYSTNLFRTTDKEDYIPWVATSWYLTKVRDRFGHILFSLSYKRGKFTAQLYKTAYSQSFGISNGSGYFSGGHNEFSVSTGYSGTLNLPVYLTRISSLGGEIADFTMKNAYAAGSAARNLYPSLYTNGNNSGSYLINGLADYNLYPFYYLQSSNDSIRYRRAYSQNVIRDPLCAIDMQILDSISVHSDIIEVPIRRNYVFEYDSIARLHLSGLSIRAVNGQLMKYTFKYNNYAGVPQDYLTDHVDHWGYLTQKYLNNNNTPQPFQPGIPDIIEDEGNPGSPSVQEINRTPILEYALKGMLTEIVYPTGGKSQFEYELNDYSCVLSSDRQSMISESGVAGGLRVRSIRDSSDMASDRTRNFTYLDMQGHSSGELFTRPSYGWCWSQPNAHIYVYQDVPVIPLSTATGSHIGYSYVTETSADSTQHLYHYNNFSDVKDELPIMTTLVNPGNNTYTPSPYEGFSERGFMRGRLLDEHVIGNDGTIWSETYYTFRQDSAEYASEYSYTSNVSVVPSTSGAATIFGIGNVFKLYFPKYDVVKVVSSVRHGNSFITDTTDYVRQRFKQSVNGWRVAPFFRKCISERTSRGNASLSKHYGYITHDSVTAFMPLFQTITKEGNTTVQTETTVYGSYGGKFQPLYETIKKGSVTDTLVSYNGYNNRGLLTSYTKAGEYPTRLFWDISDHLLASVTSPYTDLVLPPRASLSSEDYTPLNLITRQGQSIFNFPDTKATTYIYNHWGYLCSSATGNGVVTYYLYDAFGRLSEIQDADHHTLQRFTYNYSTSSVQ